MVGFIIPFKSKARSKNWIQDSALLKRTIGSVLNQMDKNFRCYVVYSDLPQNPVEHHQVNWIHFPYPFLESHQIDDEERSAVQYGLGKFLPNFYDQGKKSMYGCSFAKKDGCTYIMSLDADDLISNKLVHFIEQDSDKQPCGWYINKGYMYAEKSSFLLRVPGNMNYVCASVNIIRSDLIPDPDFSKKEYKEFQFFSSHAYMPEAIMFKNNMVVQPLPFYCVAYVIHNGNFFTDSSQLTKLNFRNVLKRCIRGKYLTGHTRKEFGIYNLEL